jgi:DNA-directed RNA polymerase specialized sigma24 family protein
VASEHPGGLIWRRMTWIALIEQELPRLRLYASALLGGPQAGDTAVEEALCDLIKAWLPTRPERFRLFCLVDVHVRAASAYAPAERLELLHHVCGFTQTESQSILDWKGLTDLQSAS